MLKTLQRDWWKLLLIVLVCGGLSILTNESTIILYVQSILEKLSVTQMYVITGLILIVISIFNILFQHILPACIHEQKNLWNIGWKYLALRILCEIILAIVPIVLPFLHEVRPLFIAVMLVYFIIISTLLLGFLCAAANSTGLLTGIKTLITKYLLKYVCILLIFWLIQKIPTLLMGVDFMRTSMTKVTFIYGIISAIIQIAIVYICLPLFKEPAK